MAKHKQRKQKVQSNSGNSSANSSTKLAFYKRPHFYFLLIVPFAGVLLVVQLMPPISPVPSAKTSAPPVVPSILPPVKTPAIPPVIPSVPSDLSLPSTLADAVKSKYQRKNPSVFPGARVGFPKVKSWVQGDPITTYESGKIYFIELFSTTCSNCMEVAPIVAELVRQNQPLGVRFVSISKEEPPPLITWLEKPEVKAEVNYPIASDPGLASERMFQYGTFKNSTPRVFLVKDGIVQWYGHPTDAEKPLTELVAGTWNPPKIQD